MRKDECKLLNNNIIGNKNYSLYASKDTDSIRFGKIVEDIRGNYFRDTDRVLYSLSYARYMDKTQVFSLTDNDHVSKRMLHVQMVSRVARTIGRALWLNEDLIEAAALGHDLGHPPFGHVGEKILNKLSLKYNKTFFNHNVQSVRILKDLENNGKGSNVSVQVLDAILCHNGEVELSKYIYNNKKSVDDFLEDYQKCYNIKNYALNLMPMTLEAVVVRVCDIIAYIGKDLEDAIELNLISRSDIPNCIKDVLGDTNSKIINTIVLDIVNNSYGKPHLQISDNIFKVIKELKEFNYKYIYNVANTNRRILLYERMYTELFSLYVDQVVNNDKDAQININYLNKMHSSYKTNNNVYQIVIDYISSMTDDYFINQYEKYFSKVNL